MTKRIIALVVSLLAVSLIGPSLISSPAHAAIGCLPGHCPGDPDDGSNDDNTPPPAPRPPDRRPRVDEFGSVTLPTRYCNSHVIQDAQAKALSAARAIVKSKTGAPDKEIRYGNDQALFIQCSADPNSTEDGEITVTVKAWFLIALSKYAHAPSCEGRCQRHRKGSPDVQSRPSRNTATYRVGEGSFEE